MRIDLHCHSTASDGTEPPDEVVRRAGAAGVDVLALTDHDTVAGLGAAAGALPAGLTLVPGMELSCRRDGRSIHMLAYLFDPADPVLAGECRAIRDSREQRARRMVERLAELGVPLRWEDVAALAADGVVGRPHLARAMVAAGVIAEPHEAFTAAWIAPGGRAHVPRYAPDPRDAVRLIKAAGGAAVLAHPGAETRGGTVGNELIAELAEAGLFGIEVDHPQHDPGTRDRLRALAAELDLSVSGGSDDHGELTGHRLGRESAGVETLDRLLATATGIAPIRL